MAETLPSFQPADPAVPAGADDAGQLPAALLPGALLPGALLPGVLVRHDPQPDRVTPLVLDSPHSGRHYPRDFGHAVPLETLRRAEDAFVDELFATAPTYGATLLAALFPRSYIDPNRHEHDIDLGLLGEPWPHPARPTERSARGLGLVRRLVRPDVAVYDRLLSAAEVEGRIERCHRPYHAELTRLIDRLHGRFGAVWHLNCHSMRSRARVRGGDGAPRADFVLGDLDGASCDAGFTAFVAGALRDLGYSVGINHPFKGAELVRRHGDPSRRRHSLQIEINRGLYMDEGRIEKTDGFAALKRDIERLIAAVAGHARAAVR